MKFKQNVDLKKGDIAMYKIFLKTIQELSLELKDAELDNSYNIPIYKGFRFFSPIDITENRVVFITSYNSDNDIIGVIKIKELICDNKPCKAILFVDVREDYRNKGIATSMIKELNNHITVKDKVVMSALTKLGKIAKLNKILIQSITNTKYLYDEDMRKLR